MTKSSTPLTDLAIDQYSRQAWAALFIDQLRGNKQTFKIVDVGGYKGQTKNFHPHDKVIICDLFNIKEKDYIKGDGRHLPFKDKVYDFSVCFDTYEHVPRSDRKQFLSEMIRVSKTGVIVAAPFDDSQKAVSSTEAMLNQYYKDLYKVDHAWLKEHIQYKLSTQTEIEDILNLLGASYTSMPSNDLGLWSLIQHIYLSIDLDEDLRGRVDDINRFYNKHLNNIDVTEGIAYRRIYFISKEPSLIDQIANFIGNQGKLHQETKDELISIAMSIFGKKYRDVEIYKNYLETELKNDRGRFEAEKEHLETQINDLQKDLAVIHNSLVGKAALRASKIKRKLISRE